GGRAVAAPGALRDPRELGAGLRRAPFRNHWPRPARGAGMGDITDRRLLYLKGGLFLFCGLLASALILLECPRLHVALLLSVTVWCFARAYYFAFYVIEHYVDPSYRFAGLWSFARYALGKQRTSPEKPAPPSATAPAAEGSGDRRSA